KEIGGGKVKTFSATHAMQNPHYIRARPSLINKAVKADIIFCSGAGLEVGWLPLLLQKASGSVQPGTEGYLMASDFVKVLEKTMVADRTMGDVHPEGNPHVHLNPHNISLIAKELTKRLELIDATNQSFYRSRLDNFILRWEEAINRWEKNSSDLKGMQVVIHHKTFSYLIDWLELTEVASLEVKPGIPPTASHLKGLLQQFKSKSPDVIIRTPFDPGDGSMWLSEKINTPAIIMPYTINGNDNSADLFALFENSINLLKGAFNDQ
ncbi:MAG: zinc ABC transporter substrate-binding protein, partial [Pelagibacteraceae bacterium]|nr:zinc ABC transporter substrate-binding protein [Pelagibacteraceae bacterium]